MKDSDTESVNYYTNTSIRKDVMNKTLFRSIRREYKQEFKSFCEENGIKITRTTKNIEKAIVKFTNHLLENEDASLLSMTRNQFNSLFFYVGLFVDFCKMRKISNNASSKLKLKQFYGCLYGYSHKKFYEFVLTPEVNFLMKRMLTPEKIEELISKYSTLERNAKYYRISAESLAVHLRTQNEES